MTRKMRWLKTCTVMIFAAACVALLLGGCSPSESRILSLDDLAYERPEIENIEWRNAWRIPAGTGRILDFGPVAEGTVCRVGLLDGGQGQVIEATLHLDGEVVASFTTSGEQTWHDERVALPDAGVSCWLELTAEADFWLSHGEVFVPDTTAPTVLVFNIDALRQDHVGCYGYALDTTPNLDALARDAVRLTGFTAPSSWTRPSVASLFTSTYSSVHGAVDRPDVLRENLPSLALELAAGGIETHCFMTNRNCIPVWGFGGDFHRFRDADTANWVHSDDADVVDLTIEMVEDAAGRPWYAYVHTMGPHEPYEPPEDFRTRFTADMYADRRDDPAQQEILALYDGEIAYTDQQFGRLVDTLKEQGLYDNALIIVLADHGEEFWEHGGTGHGRTLYEEQLRIPFLIKLPGNAYAGEVRHGLAEMVDLAPTVLEALGLPPAPRFQGVSMMGMIRGDEPGKPMAYASLALEDALQRAAKSLEYKYIDDLARNQTRWFDLIADPGEQTPLETVPEDAPPLAQYALNTAMRGASGLHVLVMHDASVTRSIRGTIRAESADSFELRYPAALQRASLEDGVLQFSLNMIEQDPESLVPPSWEKVTKVDPFQNFWFMEREALPDSAHLILRTALEDTITLNVLADGEPVPAEHVHLGADREHVALDNLERPVQALLGDPAEYDALTLPSEFGVYVWYVPPIETVEDEELSPELREALRDLGY